MSYRLRRYDGEFVGFLTRGWRAMTRTESFRNIGSCMDITDLMNKDRALREFEERVVLAAEATHHRSLGIGHRYERALDV